MNKPKQKRRSQHAKDQVELKLEVSHYTTNLKEDGTEVLHQEEVTSNKPVPEGTEIPLPRINPTHYNQDNTSRKHENSNGLGKGQELFGATQSGEVKKNPL